jgi:trehalose 6-phosphate phosphatase
VTLEGVRADLAGAAIMLDFDGTLAPIVGDPAAARPVPEAAAVLQDLARRSLIVAIVTGRPASFVREHLDAPDVDVIGHYGLAASPPLDDTVTARIRELAMTIPGAAVEDKGLSVAVHVRRTADPDTAAATLRPSLGELADAHDLAMFEGKLVIELAPRGARKGGAVAALLERTRPRAALYAGDDVEDAAAFEVIAKAPIASCRVAVLTSGTPDRLVEVADVDVEGPAGLVALLGTL